MTEPAGARPQDVGRSHHRAGELAPETAEILERYRAAMRAELDDVLGEIRPATGQIVNPMTRDPVAPGELGIVIERPSLEKRRALWDLAIKLGRELAGGPGDGGLGDTPKLVPADPTLVRNPRAAPRLKARERRSLGG